MSWVALHILRKTIGDLAAEWHRVAEMDRRHAHDEERHGRAGAANYFSGRAAAWDEAATALEKLVKE